MAVSISTRLMLRGTHEGSECLVNYRKNEINGTHFRSGRFYNENNHWFFSTREDFAVGPFSFKEDAEAELTIFLRHVKEGGFMTKADIQNYRQLAKSRLH